MRVFRPNGSMKRTYAVDESCPLYRPGDTRAMVTTFDSASFVLHKAPISQDCRRWRHSTRQPHTGGQCEAIRSISTISFSLDSAFSCARMIRSNFAHLARTVNVRPHTDPNQIVVSQDRISVLRFAIVCTQFNSFDRVRSQSDSVVVVFVLSLPFPSFPFLFFPFLSFPLLLFPFLPLLVRLSQSEIPRWPRFSLIARLIPCSARVCVQVRFAHFHPRSDLVGRLGTTKTLVQIRRIFTRTPSLAQ